MIKKYKDIIILLICLLAVFQLYLYTMFPVFNGNDSPEIITIAYTLSVGHPPGYPLFSLMAKIFSYLSFGSPAFRINLFAIFLGMLVLLLSYFLIRQNNRIVFGNENKTINFLGVFILAFSLIFWNQTIEAKGGIYILNLLFLAILLYLSIKLFKEPNIKNLYLVSFIYGLSMANHWPSMIILFPVFAYLYIKYRNILNRRKIFAVLILFVLGLSPYLYLPIRASASAVINIGNPNNWENFWWVLSRSGYTTNLPPTAYLYHYQIAEFFKIFTSNFSFLWILIFAGGYALWKRNKKIFVFYITAVLITIAMVVFYNRTDENLIFIIDIFLIPALYILFIFIIIGCNWTIKLFKLKILKYLLLFICGIIILYLGYKSFIQNNSRNDYYSYDFGSNILSTLENGSVYLGEGDAFIFPLNYLTLVERKRQDIKLVPVLDLDFEWGIRNFIIKYGKIPMKENEIANNLDIIIKTFIDNSDIYRSTYGFYLDKMELPYICKQKGLLRKYLRKDLQISPNILKLYTYDRGFPGKYINNNSASEFINNWYMEAIRLQGDDLLQDKRPSEAIEAYKKALYFPLNDKWKYFDAEIYYNLSFAYKDLNDNDDQIIYLKKAVSIKRDYYQAYELLGMIYYNEKLWPMAKDMLEKAIQYGSENKVALQQYINQIGNIDMQAQCEAIFSQAVVLLSSGKYLKVMDLFDFLLEYHYRTADIYKNLGVYNLKKNNYNDALDYFQKVKEWGDNAEVEEYISYTYYKLGQPDKALSILKKAMQSFSNDPQLTNLYNKIVQAQGINKK